MAVALQDKGQQGPSLLFPNQALGRVQRQRPVKPIMMSFQVGFGAIYGEFGMVFPVPLLAIPFRESAAGIGVPFVERIAWLAPDSWSIRAGTVDRIAGRLENRSK